MNRAQDTSALARLDLNLFRVFAVIERERSLSRAAVVLALTQSAVSHALSRLREQLGDALFVRQGRGVTPTALASRIAPAIRAALAELERAAMHRDDFDPGRDVTAVRVAMSEELEPLVVPRLFASIRAAAPRIALASVRLDRAAMRAELTGRRFDVALDVARPTDVDLAHERIGQDELCVVASRRRRRLDRDDYLAAGHVTVSSRPSGPTLEDFAFSATGLQRRIAVRCQRYHTACLIVAGSDLLLTMPRRFVKLPLPAGEVRLFTPPLRLPSIDIHQYWAHPLDDDPANRWLRGLLSALLVS